MPSAQCKNGSWFFPTALRVNTGRLPQGLHLQPNGAIAGIPGVAGEFNLTIAYDSLVCAGMQYGPGVIYLTITTSGN